ncbi:MAG TPA: peptidoglycan-binding protein [Thermoanaerobaculia bacterium]|nr:peptidoglycan-binding protein [Thermoanaerobaculia bacterium]
MPLTREMRIEYETNYASCTTRPEFIERTNKAVARMTAARPRYEAVATATSVPWPVIAAIHTMECGGDFDCHLHNGDSLSRRTINVPAGRPMKGKPPFTWEESAVDALTLDGFTNWTDWSVAGTLYKLEGYNGMGYRKRAVPSPYLWSGSQHYTRGKYVADGRYDANAKSSQVGAAVLLKNLGAFPRPLSAAVRPGDRDCVGVR